jgi:hypothetical protein
MSYPETPASSAAAPAAPATVVWSYRLCLVGAVLAVIGIVLTLVLLPATLDAAVRVATQATQGRNTQGIDVAAVARGSAIAGAVIGVVLALAYAVLTFVFAGKLRQGRNWARIVLLIFAILQLGGLLSLYGLGFLQAAVFIVAAILSFLPASNAWFRAVGPRPATV